MFDLAIEKPSNLLKLHFSGNVSVSEAEQCGVEMRKLLAALQPGFTLLTDMTGLEAMDYACAAQIEQMMDLMDKEGVGRIARVIPDPRKDIGFSIMSLFHYRKRRVPIATFTTLAEAREQLSQM